MKVRSSNYLDTKWYHHALRIEKKEVILHYKAKSRTKTIFLSRKHAILRFFNEWKNTSI